MNEMFLGYASPVVEVINVQVERGFEGSSSNGGVDPGIGGIQ